MAESLQPTAPYHGAQQVNTEPERLRVALVGGTGPRATDDLYRLLRRRLLTLSLFLSAAITLLLAATFLRGPTPDADYSQTYREILIGSLPSFVVLLINLTTTLFLWQRPPSGVFGLRIIEVAVVGPLFGFFLIISVSSIPYEPLEWAANESQRVSSAYVGRYTNGGGLIWFFVIMAYGTFIPNTFRRAAVVVCLMAVSPIALFLVFALWARPLDEATISQVVFGLSITNSLAVALVLVSSSRIESLRRQAAEARKLGQYVLREKIGGGGMGEVYLADHVLLRRPCAIKLIRPEKAGDPAMLQRFEREVRATARLTHPNTVQVFDYGHTADGTFYYVMEYLPGLTLEELVRRHGSLPPNRAVHFLRQVCAALGEAHALGLTHRDIKPGNVMVCERGGLYDVAKVLDFGLVRVPKDDEDGATLTREGTVAGTPAYMSPEQAGGEAIIDPLSDIYSVGALAYFLLTGKPPFPDRSAARMLAAHLYEPPGALPEAVPEDLAAVVMRCLAKAPSDRWPNAASLEAALVSTQMTVWSPIDAAAWWLDVTSEPPASHVKPPDAPSDLRKT